MSITRAISIPVLATSIAILAACGGGGSSGAGDVNSSGNNLTGTSATNTSGNNTAGTPTSNTTTTNTGSAAAAPVSSASYAYILQAASNASSMTADTFYTGGSVLKCAVDANGALTACSASGMPALNNPLSIAISGTNAYILNQTAPDLQGGVGGGGQFPVLKCTVQADGTLSGCADTFPGNSLETEFAFKLIATANSGYALKERQLLKCPSDFSNKCGADPSSVSLPASVSASDMLFADNRIFVVNAGTDSSVPSILSWGIDPVSGALSAASSTVTDASFTTALRYDGGKLDTPIGIAIKGANSYILTRTANKVVQCTYNSAANTMTACTETTPLSALAGITPRNIAIQGSYAYITDSSSTAAGNSVVKCTIGSTDGRLGSCALQSGATFSTAIVDLVFR